MILKHLRVTKVFQFPKVSVEPETIANVNLTSLQLAISSLGRLHAVLLLQIRDLSALPSQ